MEQAAIWHWCWLLNAIALKKKKSMTLGIIIFNTLIFFFFNPGIEKLEGLMTQGAGIAQVVECLTEKPGTMLMRV